MEHGGCALEKCFYRQAKNYSTMAEKEYIEDWVLITLSISNRTNGIYPPDIYYEKPKGIDTDITNFYRLIDNLTNKGLIKKFGWYINLTKEGEQELEKRMVDLRKRDSEKYLELISSSPIFELKERVTIIEKFLNYGVLTSFFFFASNVALSDSPNFSFVMAILGLIFFIRTSFYLVDLVTFAGRGSREKIIRKTFDTTQKHSKLIFYFLFFIFISLIVFVLNKYTPMTWIWSLATLVLTLIGTAIWNIFKLEEKFRKKIGDLFKNK